jgi:hypothetical protein
MNKIYIERSVRKMTNLLQEIQKELTVDALGQNEGTMEFAQCLMTELLRQADLSVAPEHKTRNLKKYKQLLLKADKALDSIFQD